MTCIQCKENERKLGGPTDRPNDQQTAAEQYALPSSKGGIKIQIRVNIFIQWEDDSGKLTDKQTKGMIIIQVHFCKTSKALKKMSIIYTKDKPYPVILR
jgi:hypothetical protein